MRTPFAAVAALAFATACGTAAAQTSSNSAAPVSPATDPGSAAATQTTPATQTAQPAQPAPVVDNPLDPVVVTAARTRQPLSDALPQTTSFNAQDIANSGAVDLPSLLQFAPGAEIVTNGPPGSNTSLFLRGADSDQSLVLLDGIRLDGAGTGSTQISQLMLAGIDRVEVVNGNVSALYGSSAVGGVVQLFTKDGGDYPPRVSLETEYGSYHTQRQTFSVDGALDKDGSTTFSFTASRFKTDGFSALNPQLAPDANPNANGFLDTTISGTLKHRFNDDWDAGIRFYQADGRPSFDDSFGLPTDLNNSVNRDQMIQAFVDGKLTDRWNSHLVVANGTDDNSTYLNGVFQDRFNTTNHQLNWTNEFALAQQQQIVFGYSHQDQALDTNDFSAPDRHVNSGYVGYNGRFGASQIQLNVRRDQYSDFGGANTYYAGYGYNFDTHWKAILSASSSFNAPSFDNLFFPDFGTPTLQPEYAHSFEGALQYASDTLGVVRVTAFQTRYRNLIESVQTSPGDFFAENVDRAKVQGLETTWSGRFAQTDVRASVTFQNPEDETDDVILERRARQFGSLSVAHPFGGWRVGGDWYVSGPTVDSGNPLAGYGVLNLSARYDINPSWHVTAQLANVLNRNYEVAFAFNTPGRGAYVTLGWQQR
jgi:vitamin B12 transporter